MIWEERGQNRRPVRDEDEEETKKIETNSEVILERDLSTRRVVETSDWNLMEGRGRGRKAKKGETHDILPNPLGLEQSQSSNLKRMVGSSIEERTRLTDGADEILRTYDPADSPARETESLSRRDDVTKTVKQGEKAGRRNGKERRRGGIDLGETVDDDDRVLDRKGIKGAISSGRGGKDELDATSEQTSLTSSTSAAAERDRPLNSSPYM